MNIKSKIIVDIDNTISIKEPGQDYQNAQVNHNVVEKLKHYRGMGFTICLFTSRNMNTFDGNQGLINVHTIPKILTWLKNHEIPYDELLVGKPWCGPDGFYVDDRAVRPSEFANLTFEEIQKILE